MNNIGAIEAGNSVMTVNVYQLPGTLVHTETAAPLAIPVSIDRVYTAQVLA